MSKHFPVISAIFLLIGCQPNAKEYHQTPLDSTGSNTALVTNRQFKESEVQQILRELPTPYKLALLFAAESKDCPHEFFASTNSARKFLSELDQSLITGIYQTNQAFAAICSNKEAFLEADRSERQFAEKLQLPVTNEIILDSIRKVEGADTLQQLYQELFIRRDVQLKTETEQEKAIWIVSASWIESMFLGSKMITEKSNSYKKIIAEQKPSLNLLLRLWNSLDVKIDDELQDRLEVLSAIYGKVELNANMEDTFLLANEQESDSSLIANEKIKMSLPVLEAIESEIRSIRSFMVKESFSEK